MASEAPSSIEVTDIQFKLHSKFQLIQQEVNENKGNLLAAASAYGLVIVGTSEANLKVIQLSQIITDKGKDAVPSRTIPLPAPPHAIALSCDHSMLAVNFKQNELAFVTVFSVQSFLSNNIKIVHQSIRLCTDDGVTATQLLWNPVLAATLAICLSNQSLLVFSFKEQGYDFYSIDKSEQVGCASWSPKGKQIVAGFPNGKLAQCKPDLKLARTIPCTVGLYHTVWDVIAVQWLSTYQFAAVMLSKDENAYPALYIIYAPKNGSPTYTNYYDVCFSQSGPRHAQVMLNHILPWNLLLVLSANSMDVGILGATETGDNPLWKQYTMLDEARAELPLTADQREMFPLGMDVDTGTTHRLIINETQLPVMPMLHILSTHGLLISFNILNTATNCPSICSPPQLIADTSGIGNFILPTNLANLPPPTSDISFGFPAAATSTPNAGQKFGSYSTTTDSPKAAVGLFQTNASQVEPTKGLTNLFGGQTTIQPIHPPSTQSAFSFVQKPTEPSVTAFGKLSQPGLFGTTQSLTTKSTPAAPTIQTKPISMQPATSDQTSKSEISKPFITVAPTFAQVPQSNINPTEKTMRLKPAEERIIRDDDIIRKMIVEEIHSYETLAKAFLKRCKSVDVRIGTKDESLGMLKQLNELQDISNQATESTEALSAEIQSLKVSLNETYLMVAELKSKHSLLYDANYTQLSDVNAMSQTSRRQLEKLQKLLAVNENQYRIISQQINAHWSTYEENKKLNARAKMHIPSLENIYQTLTKQRDIINRQKMKINHIKSRLGYKDSFNASKKCQEFNITSLTDSMVSMSLCDQVKLETERLSTDKLNSLRDLLKNRKIIQITPKRPERIGLSSEIVMEKRKAQEKKKTLASPKAVSTATPKQVNSQPRTHAFAQQPVAKEVSKYSSPEAGFQLSKSTSKSELPGILKSNKTIAKGVSNENSEITKHVVSFSADPTKEAKSKMEPSIGISKANDSTVKGLQPSDNAQSAFGTKMPITFGNSSGGEKPSNALGGSLFANMNLASNNQPSVFGSSTPTPIPFGSQSSNTMQNLSKSDPTKPSPLSDANIQKSAIKITDKENVHKIEVPKPLHSGIFQEKLDSVPKSVQPFGMPAAAPPPSISFGNSGTKDSTSVLSLLTSNDTSKPSFSIAASIAQNMPTVPVNSAPANAVVGTSVQSDFTFSLDKMGITPKAPADVPQKTIFNLDSKIEAASTNVKTTSSNDTDKLIENLTVCSPSSADKEITPASGGNIFSISSFTTPTKADNSPSIFGGNPKSTSSPFSNFGNVSVTSAAPISKASIFASPFSSPNVTVSTTSANVPSTVFEKTDQSPFGQSKSSSLFGTPANQPSTNVFGTSTNAFGTSTASSTPFGSSVSTTNAFGTATTNAFSSTDTTSAFGTASSTNVFGAATTNAFGANTNTFGTTASNAFGSSTSPSSIFGGQSTTTANAFGSSPGNAYNSTKSIFGGGSDQAASGSSLFGASNAAATTSPFGQTSSQSTGSLFGSSSFGTGNQASTGSIFGGSSTSAAGFGQPTAFGSSSFSQQSSSPFGAPPAQGSFSPQSPPQTGFGAAPTFGGQATFGAAPTFGSPKSFGSFANVPNAFGAPTQQNSLFETFGSSDTGLSFGNIAQNSNTSAPPAFGGGSFSTWR